MALPSGYVLIDYIESTGTQYINTSFTPKGNSRIVMDCELTDVSKTSCFFCARNRVSGTDSMSNTSFLVNGKYRRDYYGASKSTTASYAANQRFIVDANKETVTYGSDYTLSFTSTSTASPMPWILMASAALGDTLGSVSNFANYASMKLYSCQIYDNGTLVRDFVPCKTDSGELGLYDNIDSRFYANAGTGTFVAGADAIQDNNKHKTLIDSTGYEIKSGRVLIAGTGYDVKKGRTLIGGTGYDLKFGVPVGELAVGTSVFIDFSGTRREFIVVNQGNPDTTKYDASCNGTWLWQKYAYESRDWNYVDYNYTFRVSGIYTWLNEDYLNMIDSGIAALIKTVKIPDQYYNGSTWQYTTGANGLETKAFLPSFSELGMTSVQDRYYSWSITQQIGSKLNYFSSKGAVTTVNNAFADCKVSDANGNAVEWFVRQVPEQENWSDVTYIQRDGSVSFKILTSSSNGTLKMYTAYVCPLLILPSDAKIDDNFNIVPA